MFFSTSVDCFFSAWVSHSPVTVEHRQQVLGLVLGVFVEVEEQRALLVRAAPDAVALEELARGQLLVAAPELVVLAAAAEEFAQARQRRRGPHQVAARPATSRPLRSRRTLNLPPCLAASVSTKCEHIRSSTGASFSPGEGSTCTSSGRLTMEASSGVQARAAWRTITRLRCYMEAAACENASHGARAFAPTMAPMLDLADIRAAAARLQGQVLRHALRRIAHAVAS